MAKYHKWMILFSLFFIFLSSDSSQDDGLWFDDSSDDGNPDDDHGADVENVENVENPLGEKSSSEDVVLRSIPTENNVPVVKVDTEEKTKPVELGDVSTGSVRDELRKIAEELLPSKADLDIYGIKSTLHGKCLGRYID